MDSCNDVDAIFEGGINVPVAPQDPGLSQVAWGYFFRSLARAYKEKARQCLGQRNSLLSSALG